MMVKIQGLGHHSVWCTAKTTQHTETDFAKISQNILSSVSSAVEAVIVIVYGLETPSKNSKRHHRVPDFLVHRGNCFICIMDTPQLHHLTF